MKLKIKNTAKALFVSGAVTASLLTGCNVWEQQTEKIEKVAARYEEQGIRYLITEVHRIEQKSFNSDFDQFEFYGTNNRTGTDKEGVYFLQENVIVQDQYIKKGDYVKVYYLETGLDEDIFIAVEKINGKKAKKK